MILHALAGQAMEDEPVADAIRGDLEGDGEQAEEGDVPDQGPVPRRPAGEGDRSQEPQQNADHVAGLAHGRAQRPFPDDKLVDQVAARLERLIARQLRHENDDHRFDHEPQELIDPHRCLSGVPHRACPYWPAILAAFPTGSPTSDATATPLPCFAGSRCLTWPGFRGSIPGHALPVGPAGAFSPPPSSSRSRGR